MLLVFRNGIVFLAANKNLMKKTLFISIALLITLFASAQTFEGLLVYTNTYKSKTPNVTDAQFTSMLGSTQDYYIKGGNYKSVVNGTFLQSQLYVNKENRLYTKVSNNEALLWNDGALNDAEIIKVESNKGVITVLGYLCDELIFTTKTGIEKYYFTAAIAIDPQLYANHKYGNWYDLISRSKSLPLKTIVENDNFILESTATAMKAMKIEDSFFALPSDAKIEKSPGK
jgi:hypothetical protein